MLSWHSHRAARSAQVGRPAVGHVSTILVVACHIRAGCALASRMFFLDELPE
jgi:hypothetical protein